MMDKDAYYFPHFCNARHDRKIQRLRMELGVEGYGIFFMLLEVLRDQTDFTYPLDDIKLLAKEFDTSEQKVKTVILNYQLFEIDEINNFFSPKMLVYLEPFFAMKNQRKQAAISRWSKEKCDRISGAMQSKVKESKVKESKVKESKVKENDILSNEEIQNEERVKKLYTLYPSYCTISNRPTGKCSKDKEHIKRIVSKIGYDKLKNFIETYITQCSNSKTYLMNLKTFLDRLPEVEESKPIEKPITDYEYNNYKAGIITFKMIEGLYEMGKVKKEEYEKCLALHQNTTASNPK